MSDFEREVRTLRSSVGVSLQPQMRVTRISGAGAFAFMDRLLPCELFIHDGQMKHTLILGSGGAPIADVYACADGDAFLLVTEGAHDLGASPADVSVEPFDAHTFVSLNGPFAWELLAELEGPGAIGLPYLTFYRPRPDRIYFRAGKTGEYGYDLLVPSSEAEALVALLLDRGAAFDARPVGVAALHHAALENWFFNIHRAEQRALSPIELQLQWRISYDKVERRPCTRRITALRSSAFLQKGDPVFAGEQLIGEVLIAERSVTLGGAPIAVALLDVEYAWSGINAYRAGAGAGAGGHAVRTVSAPFVDNLSTFVNVHRDRYARRNAIAFPGHDRHRA